MSAGEGVQQPGSRDKGDTAEFAVVLLVTGELVETLSGAMPQIRRGELRRRRVRRKKLAALRYRYANAEDEAEKAGVLKKLFSVAPWLTLEFRAKAQPAALPSAAPPEKDVGRRRKTAKRARGEAEGVGPRAE